MHEAHCVDGPYTLDLTKTCDKTNYIKHFVERYKPITGPRVGMGGATVELLVVSVGCRLVVPLPMVVVVGVVVLGEAVVMPLTGLVE